MAIQRQKQSKTLFLGDSCLDEYIFGECTRLSPEAPVPVVLHKSTKTIKGMASNAVENFKNVSGNPVKFLTNNPEEIKKVRFVDNKSNYQIMRYDFEKTLDPIKKKDLPEEEFDVVVISDYNKGFVSNEIVSEIRKKYSNAKIFVDTKRKDLSIFSNCVLKLNELEFKEAIGKNDTMDFVITLGPRGAMWKNKIFPTKKVEVHDVCGAGDVFLASLVWMWSETHSMEKSIEFANKCAAYSVTKIGTYQITKEEYKELKNE